MSRVFLSDMMAGCSGKPEAAAATRIAPASGASATATTTTGLVRLTAPPSGELPLAIVVGKGAEVLDFTGPLEVFASAPLGSNSGSTRPVGGRRFAVKMRPVSAHRRTILIVQTGDPVASVGAVRGPFAQMIRDAIGPLWDGDYRVTDARTEEPPSLEGIAAIVITGSASYVPDREPWMLRTEAWLRDVVKAGVPTFGICFGHQILAQALGGEVIKNPRGREMGTQTITKRADDPIFEGVPSEFRANVTHLDTVGRLPPGAVSLARSPMEEHHAIRFTETCYGVQFHPEIDAEIMRGYIEARRETLASEGIGVDALLAGVTNGEAGTATLRNFLHRFVR